MESALFLPVRLLRRGPSSSVFLASGGTEPSVWLPWIFWDLSRGCFSLEPLLATHGLLAPVEPLDPAVTPVPAGLLVPAEPPVPFEPSVPVGLSIPVEPKVPVVRGFQGLPRFFLGLCFRLSHSGIVRGR